MFHQLALKCRPLQPLLMNIHPLLLIMIEYFVTGKYQQDDINGKNVLDVDEINKEKQEFLFGKI